MARIPGGPSFLYVRVVVLSFDFFKKRCYISIGDNFDNGVTATIYPWEFSVSDSLSCNAGWKV